MNLAEYETFTEEVDASLATPAVTTFVAAGPCLIRRFGAQIPVAEATGYNLVLTVTGKNGARTPFKTCVIPAAADGPTYWAQVTPAPGFDRLATPAEAEPYRVEAGEVVTITQSAQGAAAQAIRFIEFRNLPFDVDSDANVKLDPA